MVLGTMSVELAGILFLIALFGGVGISTVGPGGIFVTIALFALLPISSATVAGTASATFIATGGLATGLYYLSGEFGEGFAREIAVILSVMSIVGAYIGSQANLFTSDELFGYLLSVFVAAIGLLIVYRETKGLEATNQLAAVTDWQRRTILGGIGFGVGFLGGMLGVGGPVIAVPILVVLGVPMLVAVAVTQVQSIFISTFATVGYYVADAVSLGLVLLVGIPQLVGVVVGWRIAHRVAEGKLRVVLGVVLVLIAPVLAL